MYRFAVEHNGLPGAATHRIMFISGPSHWALFVAAHFYVFPWLYSDVAHWFISARFYSLASGIKSVVEFLSWNNGEWDLASSMKMATAVWVISTPCWIMFWRVRQILGEGLEAKLNEKAKQEEAQRGEAMLRHARESETFRKWEKDLTDSLNRSTGRSSPEPINERTDREPPEPVKAERGTSERVERTDYDKDEFRDRLIRDKARGIVKSYPDKVKLTMSRHGAEVATFGALILTQEDDLLVILEDRVLRYDILKKTITADIPLARIPVEKLTKHLGEPLLRRASEYGETGNVIHTSSLFGEEKHEFETWSFDVRAVNDRNREVLEDRYGLNLGENWTKLLKTEMGKAAASINLLIFILGSRSRKYANTREWTPADWHPYVIHLYVSRSSDCDAPVVGKVGSVSVEYGDKEELKILKRESQPSTVDSL